MIDWEKIRTTEDKNWLIFLIKSNIPSEVRTAAVRLYELGEKDIAFEALLKQMTSYKAPEVHRNTKYETCTNTMITLGQLGDNRAIEYLIEAFDEFTDLSAFSLSLIGGSALEKKMLELSQSDGIRGFGAKLSLGFMGNKEVLPALINILENEEEYKKRFHGKIMWFLRWDILYMLGNYDNEIAKKTFVNNLERSDIKHFLSDWLDVTRRSSFYKYTDLATLGWKITKKYTWDKYLDTEEKRNVFTYTNPEKLVEDLRNEIVEKIWKEVKGDK